MKVGVYIVIMITMILFLEFSGFHTPAGAMLNSTLGYSINNQTSVLETGDIKQSIFYNDIFLKGSGLLMIVATAGAVIVGLYSKSFDWKLVLVAFMTEVVILFAATGWIIVQYSRTTGQDWLVAVIATIFLPITGGFIWAIINWFGSGE